MTTEDLKAPKKNSSVVQSRVPVHISAQGLARYETWSHVIEVSAVTKCRCGVAEQQHLHICVDFRLALRDKSDLGSLALF